MRHRTGTVAATLAAALLVALLPAAAAAQSPVARVVLYEVWETLDLRGVSIDLSNPDPESFRRRFAEAGLLGRQVRAVSGPFASADLVVAEASSNVNIDIGSPRFGTGPIRGEFQILKYLPLDGNDVENLSDFVITHEGRLSGTLDLRPALAPPPLQLPLALVSGTWNLQGAGGGHRRFVGAFLIPFRMNGGLFYLIPSDPTQAALFGGLCPSGGIAVAAGVLCPVTPAESVLGFPLTKAVILLLE